MKLLLLLLAVAAATAADCSHNAPCEECLSNPDCIYYETQKSGRFCSQDDDLPHLQKIFSQAKCSSQPESEDPVDFSMTRLGSVGGSASTIGVNEVQSSKDIEPVSTTPAPATAESAKEKITANDTGKDIGLDGQPNAEQISTTPPSVGEEEEADGQFAVGKDGDDHVGAIMIHTRIINGNSTVVLRSSVKGALTANVNETSINLRFHSSGTKSTFNLFTFFLFLFFII